MTIKIVEREKAGRKWYERTLYTGESETEAAFVEYTLTRQYHRKRIVVVEASGNSVVMLQVD